MSLTKVSYSMITGAPVTPQDFGAKGDGITNDTAALQAMFATNQPWYIPYTDNGYLISGELTINSNGLCDGKIVTIAGYAGIAVTVVGGYNTGRKITGLFVFSTSIRTALSKGIQMTTPGIVLDRCKATRFDLGIVVASWSIELLNCNSYQCNTNLTAYAVSNAYEINDLKVIGGTYDSAVDYSAVIGDTRAATSIPLNDPMGSSILLIGADFEGAPLKLDRLITVNVIGCYHEGIDSGDAIQLGGAGNNVLRNVTIQGCFMTRVDYGIKCFSAIAGLNVKPNFYGGGIICALYTVANNVTGFSYESGSSTSGFEGPEVHTGYQFATIDQLTFSGASISSDWLFQGVQIAPQTNSTGNWYAYGKTIDGKTNIASATGRFRNTPATSIAGTMSGSNFTCTTLSDALKFNGGDRVSGAGGSVLVNYVNYETGVINVNGSGSGASTISQEQSFFRLVNIAAAAAPTTGTYKVGDIVYNIAPTAGSYIGFVCTTAGTPGTWKTFGAIAA